MCLFQPCTHFAQSFNRESNGDSDVGGGRVLKEGRFYTPWGYLEGGSVLGQQAGGGGCGVGSRCLKARNQKPKLQGTFPMAQTRTPPRGGVPAPRSTGNPSPWWKEFSKKNRFKNISILTILKNGNASAPGWLLLPTTPLGSEKNKSAAKQSTSPRTGPWYALNCFHNTTDVEM